MDKIKIALLLGTARQGARAEVYAQLAKGIGEKLDNVEIMYVDPKTLNLPGEGEDVKDPEYSRITSEADAFFIVTPEYNHSFPGSLKRMLDSEFSNYKHKPVVIAGISNGQFGGARAIEALITVVHRLGMVPCYTEVPNPNINDLINDDETITDQVTIDRINAAFEELIWYARALVKNSNG